MNFPVSRDKLNIKVKILAISKGIVSRITFGILFGPVALRLFSAKIISCISFTFVADKKKDSVCFSLRKDLKLLLEAGILDLISLAMVVK